jgi:Acetyl-CoA dehydrogenase C-terminal like/Acyl-CoA dehydrogenase, C-terminal domain
MFEVIEYARMMVGTKAIGTLSAGYRTALAYARERVQGPDLTRAADKTAPRVTITHHADVRRMLMLQKAYAEGLRALYLFTATQQDAVRAGGPDAPRAAAVNDLLLPIVKGVGSERASEMLVLSLQTLGGSGYLQDYPVEQYVRDAKIDSLYEGTTAIQSLDLLFRKIVRDRGRAFGYVAGEIEEFLGQESGNGRLKEERALLATALADVRGMLDALTGHVAASAREPARVHRAGQHSVRLLMAVGDLLVGWLLLRRAEVALAALAGDLPTRDRTFYDGKVAVARFFAATRLPPLSAERAIVDSADDALMELAEEAF